MTEKAGMTAVDATADEALRKAPRMRRWLTGGDGIEALRVEEVPRPEPGAGQVLVRVEALALNYRDLLVIEGRSTWRLTVPRGSARGAGKFG